MRLRDIFLTSVLLTVAASAAVWFGNVPSADAADRRGWVVEPTSAVSVIDHDDPTILDTRSKSAWQSGHLEGAVRFDWEAFTPSAKARRGTLLEDDSALQSQLRELGISDDRPVLVVGADDGGWGEAGRAVWMLRTLGHESAAWVDGGHAALVAEGLETTTDEPNPETGDVSVERREAWSISRSRLRDIHGRDDVVLLDTREPREYRGETPYGEARGGHIPGAEHLYFKKLLDQQGRLRDASEIRATVRELGVDDDDTIVTYCTGGVRSAWVASVLIEVGYEDVRNYAGSTWEWAAGSSETYPLETD